MILKTIVVITKNTANINASAFFDGQSSSFLFILLSPVSVAVVYFFCIQHLTDEPCSRVHIANGLVCFRELHRIKLFLGAVVIEH